MGHWYLLFMGTDVLEMESGSDELTNVTELYT